MPRARCELCKKPLKTGKVRLVPKWAVAPGMACEYHRVCSKKCEDTLRAAKALEGMGKKPSGAVTLDSFNPLLQKLYALNTTKVVNARIEMSGKVSSSILQQMLPSKESTK